MDIEFGGKEHEAAIARTLKACKGAGKKAAIFCKSEDEADIVNVMADCWSTGMTGAQSKKRLQQGFDMVSIATDTDSIIREFSRQLEDVKA